MAVGASGLVSIAESLLPIMAGSTLKHRGLAPFHLEQLIVTVCTYEFLQVDMGLMAESHTTRTSVGFVRDVATGRFLLLGTYEYWEQDQDGNHQGSTKSLLQVLTSYLATHHIQPLQPKAL
jgi:hypothetical protein